MAKLWPSPRKDKWMMLGANIRLLLSPSRVKGGDAYAKQIGMKAVLLK